MAIHTILIGTLVLTPIAATADWPQWRGAGRDGVVACGPALANAWPPDGPVRFWESEKLADKVDEGSGGGYGSVVVVDDRVYLFVNRKFFKDDEDDPSAEDIILCFDARTGRTVWKTTRSGAARHWGSSSTPCVVGDRLFVVGGTGLVYCVDSDTGCIVWESAPNEGPADVSSSVQIVDGKVIVMSGPLSALDPQDGKVLWQQPAVMGRENSTVTWDQNGQPLLICNDKGSNKAVCVRPDDGSVVWSVDGGSWSTAVVAANHLVVNGEKSLAAYRLEADGPKKLWAHEELMDRAASPLVYDGHVYHFGSRGTAACVELATGDIKWQEKISDAEISSPVVADNKIFMSLGYAQKLLLAEATPDRYEPLAEVNLPVQRASSPAIVNGRLYMRLTYSVVCYDVTDGAAEARDDDRRQTTAALAGADN